MNDTCDDLDDSLELFKSSAIVTVSELQKMSSFFGRLSFDKHMDFSSSSMRYIGALRDLERLLEKEISLKDYEFLNE